jgi:hypothetical protein
MKLALKTALTLALLLSSSCALMFNDDKAEVTINSTPSGADIFINGKNYGKTPATIKIEAINQTVVLSKEGYGSTQLQLETWYAVKNGKCMADALGTMFVVPVFSFLKNKCSEFKEKEYFANIPNVGGIGMGRSSSMVGSGNNPQDMINYYYNQDVSGYSRQRKGVQQY